MATAAAAAAATAAVAAGIAAWIACLPQGGSQQCSRAHEELNPGTEGGMGLWASSERQSEGWGIGKAEPGAANAAKMYRAVDARSLQISSWGMLCSTVNGHFMV